MKNILILVLISICYCVNAQYNPVKIRLDYKLNRTKNMLSIYFVNCTDSVVFVKYCFDHQTSGELKPNIDISFKRKGSDKYWTPIASEYIPNDNNCFQKIGPRSEIAYTVDLDLSFRDNISMKDYSEIKVDVITEVIVGYNIYHNYRISNTSLLNKCDSNSLHCDSLNCIDKERNHPRIHE